VNNVKVREYISGDSEKISSFFTEQTPYLRDSTFWIWINRMISDEKSIIIVAEFENKIIGHYAIIPQQVNVFGKTYSAAFAIHAFIHPDFRKSFLIFQITKKMYKVAKEHGIDFLYGFPNENFRDIQIKADKWKQVSLFNSLEKDSTTFIDTNFSIIPIEDNYKDIYFLSEILDATTEKNNIYIQKSLNYYVNRYIRHPQKLYQNFFIVQNDQRVGFICLKIYDNGQSKIGHLIDYILIEDISFQDIIQTIENYFHDKVSKLSVWKFSEDTRKILLNNNFKENGLQTFLGVKMLTNNEELESTLVDFSNWNLCMGDSDAF